VALAVWLLLSADPPGAEEQLVVQAIHLCNEGTNTMRRITERGSAELNKQAWLTNLDQLFAKWEELAARPVPSSPAVQRALNRYRVELEFVCERFAQEFGRLYLLPDFMPIMHEMLAAKSAQINRWERLQTERPGLLALYPAATPLRIPGR
jgi:hypothetical protein